MKYLSSETPSSGFGLGATGVGQDTAYGLALCAGDATPSECTSCVANITNNILTLCARSKGAVLWSSLCMLRYLDEYFFGQTDDQMLSFITDGKNASDPVSFTQSATKWMNSLAKLASETSKMYAARSVSLGRSETLHIMAQCTRDLSIINCGECLRDMATILPICCAGKRGAEYLRASCIGAYYTT